MVVVVVVVAAAVVVVVVVVVAAGGGVGAVGTVGVGQIVVGLRRHVAVVVAVVAVAVVAVGFEIVVGTHLVENCCWPGP